MSKKREYPIVIETFVPPNKYATESMERSTPHCLNGELFIRKYRVTVDIIEEPVRDIRARILYLWVTGDNIHHMQPLRDAANKYGLDLEGKGFGCQRKAKP